MNSTKRKSIFDKTNGLCFYCGCKLDFDNFHMDHFEAKSNGGKVKENLVPSCPECNLCKSNLSIEEFRHKIECLSKDTFVGKLMKKYYQIEDRPIEFYFEGKEDGTL